MVGGWETLTLLACPFVEFIDKYTDRLEPVSFEGDVNCMVLLPLLPELLLSCSQVAALLMVQSAFPLIVRSAVPPAAEKLISDGEADSSALAESLFFLQPVKNSIAIRSPVTLYRFIFFIFI